jgi:hypothetical protein
MGKENDLRFVILLGYVILCFLVSPYILHDDERLCCWDDGKGHSYSLGYSILTGYALTLPCFHVIYFLRVCIFSAVHVPYARRPNHQGDLNTPV